MPFSRIRFISVAILATMLTATAFTQENKADAFYTTIRANDLAGLGAMLASGADVNTKDDKGITPLMYAAWVGSPAAMKLLLDKGADPNLTNSNGSTALMLSVTEPAKGKMLLERGADVKTATPHERRL